MMEREIYDLFTPAILNAALARFELDASPIVELGRGNNFVYCVRRGGEASVLRLTHDRQKTESLLYGELDWMRFVADHGMAVPKVIASPAGRMIESFDDGRGDRFYGMLYEDVGGERYRLSAMEPTMLRDWGDATGRLHAMARDYITGGAVRHRGDDWHYEFLAPRRHLPPDKQWVVDAYERNRQCIARLSKKVVMIHNDLHPGNFVRRDGELVLLDFDDSHVNVIEADLANVLLTLLDVPSLYGARRWSLTRDDVFDLFCAHFVPAYHRQADWSAVSVEALNAFILRRVMVLYIDWHRSRDVATFDDGWRHILGQFEAVIRDEMDVLNAAQLAELGKPLDRPGNGQRIGRRSI